MSDTVLGNSQCEKCVLHRAAHWVCLMGHGRIPAKVMVVGEAPGQQEDKAGKPFQGPAGKLLDKLLASAGLDRQDVYVTNAVKCRPPDNRTPRNPEMKACRSYLEDEFSQVKPKFVIVLGAAALKQVVGAGKITELHGSVLVKDGVTYLPTFHPAAALRDPKRLGPLNMDFKKFGSVISGKHRDAERVDVTTCMTDADLAELETALLNSRRYSFDIETSGLDYHDPEFKINSIAFGTDHGNWCVPLEHHESPWRDQKNQKMHWKRKEILQGLLKAATSYPSTVKFKRKVSGQNAKFDNNCLYQLYEITFPLNHDTMLAFHLCDETQPAGLKYRAQLHCNAPDYDVSKDVKLGKGPLKPIAQYNGEDGFYTRELESVSRRMLREQDGLEFLFDNLTMPVARAYERIERNGIYINRELLSATGDPMRQEIIDAERLMQKMSGLKRRVNWNSPQQVNDVLFNRLGLDPRGFTPGMEPSTAEGLLLMMRPDHPIIPVLLKHRQYQKLVSTYVEGWERRLRGDYIYPKFKTNGTVTGRPSCEDPNIQATPRDKRIRQLITAPDGWEFFEADYSQIELRVAAMLSGDEELSRIYLTGGDVHRTTASIVSGIPEDEIDEEQRKRAKPVNFGFLYGMGWKKFIDYALEKYEVVVSERESKLFRRRFFEKYDGLLPWHERQRRIVQATGQVRTLTGRIRHLQEVYSPDRGIQAKAERDAINSPVQGFAAELTLMSIVELDKLPSDKIKLCGTVHDAVIGRVRKDYVEEGMRTVKRIMERPPLMDILGIELSLPIEVDVKVGPWGIGRKVSF